MTNHRRETQWHAVDAERSALADTLDEITSEQWDVQSLCDQWKVRDVVAHLVDSVALTGSDLVRSRGEVSTSSIGSGPRRRSRAAGNLPSNSSPT